MGKKIQNAKTQPAAAPSPVYNTSIKAITNCDPPPPVSFWSSFSPFGAKPASQSTLPKSVLVVRDVPVRASNPHSYFSEQKKQAGSSSTQSQNHTSKASQPQTQPFRTAELSKNHINTKRDNYGTMSWR